VTSSPGLAIGLSSCTAVRPTQWLHNATTMGNSRRSAWRLTAALLRAGLNSTPGNRYAQAPATKPRHTARQPPAPMSQAREALSAGLSERPIRRVAIATAFFHTVCGRHFTLAHYLRVACSDDHDLRVHQDLAHHEGTLCPGRITVSAHVVQHASTLVAWLSAARNRCSPTPDRLLQDTEPAG